MGTDQELTRRAFVAGLCGALALVFAPLDRFVGGLGKLWAAIFGAPRQTKLYSWKDISITFNGVQLNQEYWSSADYYVDPCNTTGCASDWNTGTVDAPMETWAGLWEKFGEPVLREPLTIKVLDANGREQTRFRGTVTSVERG